MMGETFFLFNLSEMTILLFDIYSLLKLEPYYQLVCVFLTCNASPIRKHAIYILVFFFEFEICDVFYLSLLRDRLFSGDDRLSKMFWYTRGVLQKIFQQWFCKIRAILQWQTVQNLKNPQNFKDFGHFSHFPTVATVATVAAKYAPVSVTSNL